MNRGALGLLTLAFVLLVGASASTGSGGTVTPPLGQPANIVLFLTDDQSMESIQKMPFLSSQIGTGSWINFTHAYLNNSICCPSRATILTGLYSHHTGVENTGGAPDFDDRSTVATWLHNAGYRTGYYGKWHLGTLNGGWVPGYVPPGWGTFWGWTPPGGDGGGDAYYNYTLNEDGALVSYGSAADDYSTDVLARNAVRFIGAGAQPFFLYVAPRGPHNPWTPAPRDVGVYANEPVVESPDFNEPMTGKPAWWQSQPIRKQPDEEADRRAEWETALSLDDAVESLWNALIRRGLLSKTVFIFLTDNGYSFGEHRYNGKDCGYEECAHTPLLVWYPGSQAKTVNELVSNVDLAPMMAELAGITPESPVDGHSFVPLLTGPAPSDWQRTILLRGYNGGNDPGQPPTYWGVRTIHYKYIETVNTGEVELYDLDRDPYELNNVVGQTNYATIRADLAQRLLVLRTTPAHCVGCPSTRRGG